MSKLLVQKRLKFHERELFSFRLVFQITKKELLRIYEHLKLIVLVKLSLSFCDDVLENKTTRIRLGQAFNSQKGEEKKLGIKIVVKKFKAI